MTVRVVGGSNLETTAMEMITDDSEIHHASVEMKDEENNTLRVFLMGKTGSGKSATGNTILGEERFQSKASLKSVTTDVELQETVYDNMTVKVMDSPGLFDTEQGEAEVAAILVKAVASLYPGPHVLLFVVRFGRYTAEDHAVYTRLQALLDDRIQQHTIVVFTHADDLSPEQTQSIHQTIQDGPENLKKLMADCGNRFALFNNHANDKQSQVADLMRVVMKVKNDNQDQPYQCPRYAYVAEKIEEETRKRLEEVEKKELERSQHYRRLEEQLRQKDEELENRRKELDMRFQELERREKEEIKQLVEKIQTLEEQLQSQRNQKNPEEATTPRPPQPDGEQDKRLADYEEQMTKLNDRVNTLQNELNTKENDLTTERHKVVEMKNNQTVEINIKTEKERLEQELEELKNNRKHQEDEEKKMLREELEEMKKNQLGEEEARQKRIHELTGKLEELTKRVTEAQESRESERKKNDEELAKAQRTIKQFQMAQDDENQIGTATGDPFQQNSRNKPPKQSSICTVL